MWYLVPFWYNNITFVHSCILVSDNNYYYYFCSLQCLEPPLFRLQLLSLLFSSQSLLLVVSDWSDFFLLQFQSLVCVAFSPFLLSVIVTILLYYCHKPALSLSHYCTAFCVQCHESERHHNLLVQNSRNTLIFKESVKIMEVCSNNQWSNDRKPLQTECHVASANSCNNNEGTRASLLLCYNKLLI